MLQVWRIHAGLSLQIYSQCYSFIGDTSGLFGMPPVPKTSTTGMVASSLSSGQLHDTFGCKSPFQAPAQVFGQQSFGSSTQTSFPFASKEAPTTFSNPLIKATNVSGAARLLE